MFEVLFSDSRYKVLFAQDFETTGRNFKTEVLQLFSKLKGEE